MDYAASTPIDPAVKKEMEPFFGEYFGNPSSIHRYGQSASRAVFEAKRKISGVIGAGYEDIIFTGSATEANNLAIYGTWRHFKQKSKVKRPKIITFAIEHESVLRACEVISSEGGEVVLISPDKDGIIELNKLARELTPETFLVSVMHANNEIGSIQPIKEIAAILNSYKKKNNSHYPLFHTDAAQSLQYLDCDVRELGVDLMTLSAHKIYGPKGIGALYVSASARKTLVPVIFGSGQEGGFRSGTENVPHIVGFGKAVEIAIKLKKSESKRIEGLRDYFWKRLLKTSPKKVMINGSFNSRLPNNLSVYFPGHKAHDLLIGLDLLGVAASSGSACSSRMTEGSYVLKAMGLSASQSSGSLRFSLGRGTSRKDIDSVISVIIKLLGR